MSAPTQPEKQMDVVDREGEIPSAAEGLSARAATFRRQHHPRVIWLGMVTAVTLAFVLGAFSR
jgi:hypothetical protein